MTTPDKTGSKQAATQFKPGVSPNPSGRPKGSRNKLGEAFIEALYADFTEHGVAAIEMVRAAKPDQYLKVVASILPKELKVTTEIELNDEQLDQRIRQLAAALDIGLRGEDRVGEAADGEAAAPRYN